MSRILLSGASGFIGSRLREALEKDGHRVVRLTHSRVADAVWWDAEAGRIDEEALAGAAPDVVVNLAGEPIAQRWTSRARRRIRDSRVNGTAALARAIVAMHNRPATLVSGSALGYYGAHRGDDVLDEDSPPGTDFLAQVALEWERATGAAAAAGVRVVLLRTGVVLGEGGGALARMLPVFRAGLGGRLGSGRQWMSWIAMTDMVRAIRFLMDEEAVAGPVNLVSPHAARNAEFSSTLGDVLSRPAMLPAPRFALHLAFGTMADDTILASQHVVPKRLAGAGFEFRHPRLDDALRSELRR